MHVEVIEKKEYDEDHPYVPSENNGVPIEDELKNKAELFIGFIVITGILFITSLVFLIIYGGIALVMSMITFLVLALIDTAWYVHYRVWLNKELTSLAEFLNSLDLDSSEEEGKEESSDPQIEESSEIENKDD